MSAAYFTGDLIGGLDDWTPCHASLFQSAVISQQSEPLNP